MSLKAHHAAVFLFIGAVALASLAWLGLPSSAVATCSSGSNIALVNPVANTTLSGSQTLTASTSGSTTVPTDVTFMITAPSQTPLGDTGPSGSNSNTWALSWDSRSLPDGNYQLVAIAHYGTTSTYDCMSAAVPITILNSSATSTQNPTLVVSISPNPWQGHPGQSQNFSVSGIYTDQLGKQFQVSPSNGATYNWFTNAGTFSPNGGPSITLTSGQATGNFNLGVKVTMNNIVAQPTAAVYITSTTSGPGPSSSSPSPSPSPTTTISSSDGETTSALSPQQIAVLATTPTIFRPQNPTNSNPVVPVQTLGCLEQKLGGKFKSISSGQAQASTDDRLKGDQCFSGSAKIPAALAPVEPSKIAELPTATDLVKVTGLKNETIVNKSGQKVTAILLNGIGAPSSSIFIYVFSDPMVLRAQTDSSGKWSYVLENPLKPGHHEIYAVSQKEAANFVRTPAIPVAIAAASPGNQDGSLVIEHSLQPTQITFIAAAVILLGLGMFVLVRLRHHPHPQAAATAPTAPTQPSAPAASVTVPVTTSAPPSENHDSQA